MLASKSCRLSLLPAIPPIRFLVLAFDAFLYTQSCRLSLISGIGLSLNKVIFNGLLNQNYAHLRQPYVNILLAIYLSLYRVFGREVDRSCYRFHTVSLNIKDWTIYFFKQIFFNVAHLSSPNFLSDYVPDIYTYIWFR